MMWFPLVLGGFGGMLPRKKNDKNGAFWAFPEHFIINLEINIFYDNKSTTTQIICHILSKINPDAHVSTKNTFTFYKESK